MYGSQRSKGTVSDSMLGEKILLPGCKSRKAKVLSPQSISGMWSICVLFCGVCCPAALVAILEDFTLNHFIELLDLRSVIEINGCHRVEETKSFHGHESKTMLLNYIFKKSPRSNGQRFS